MKFCMPHWNALKKAITERGLWPLVAPNAQAAVNRLKQEAEGTASDSNYDPLMAAHWAIMNRAIDMGGLYLMEGDYCPLCEANKHLGTGTAEEWITGVSNYIRDYCQERHMLDFLKGEDS